MYKVNLTWMEVNSEELGFNIYRDTSPLDIYNLPPPIVTLPPNTTSWEDEEPPQDTQVYYIVSTFDDEEEVYGEEISITVGNITLNAPVISLHEIGPYHYHIGGVAEYINPYDAYIYHYTLHHADTGEEVQYSNVGDYDGEFRATVSVGSAVNKEFYVKVALYGTDIVSAPSNVVGLNVPDDVIVLSGGGSSSPPMLSWVSNITTPFEHSTDLINWQSTSPNVNLRPTGSYSTVFVRPVEEVEDSDVTSVTVQFNTFGPGDSLVKWWNKPYIVRFTSNSGRFTMPEYLPKEITNTSSMFSNNSAFNAVALASWDTAHVDNMDSMFAGCSGFNQDLSGWYVPLIPTKPAGFDSNTGFWDKVGRQPQWGVSPP